jgi:hypothetical protein
MSILQNTIRDGNFTSSQAAKLLTTGRDKKSFGAPALKYIRQKNIERILGRSISIESDAKPLQWGRLCETLVFEQLSTDYQLLSQETTVHPDYDFWVGSADAEKEDTCCEIKCPMTIESWFLLVAGGSIFALIDGFDYMGVHFDPHPQGEEYFNQIISNALINKKKYGELIVFIPYFSQLPMIRQEAEFQGINWLKYASDEELPYIHEGGEFKNITKIRFEIPQKEAALLTEKVVDGSKLLIPRKTTPLTIHDTVNDSKVIIHDKI